MKDSEISKIYYSIRRKKIIANILMAILISSLLLVSAMTKDKPITENEITNLPSYGLVKDFTLTNTRNESYSFFQDTGRIRLVNFFYTECPGDEGCSLVTLKLAQIFSKVRQNDYLDKVRMISIDFDYINDTMEDLKEYARRYTADTENWVFLIGNSTEIDQVTSDWNFYFELSSNITTPITLNHHPDGGTDPYDHSFVIYVVDQNNIIRKFLLGNNWDVQEAFESIEFLIDEMENLPMAG